jgi:sortase (surface protein transpeptidase)
VPKHDAAWYNLSAQPGAGDNVVLWGHVLRFKEAPKIPAPFANVRHLKPGAQIVLVDANGARHSYTVSEQVWVTPDEVEYILPQSSERLTLVSCIGDKVVVDGSVEMTHRLITIAVP